MEMKACEQFILSVHYEKNIRDKGIFVSVNRIISSVMLFAYVRIQQLLSIYQSYETT